MRRIGAKCCLRGIFDETDKVSCQVLAEKRRLKMKKEEKSSVKVPRE